jgi:hypothetical protein
VIEEHIGRIEKLKTERDGRHTPDRAGNKPKSPGKPGRKAGQGVFNHRPAPEPTSVSETIEVPLASTLCVDCGTVLQVKVEEATITDLPQAPKPLVKRFLREVGVCLGCGKTVRTTHPELDPSQRGATAHRVGAGVQALGATLHYHCRLPLRKMPGVIALVCGISLTQDVLSQAAMKHAHGGAVKTVYENLRKELPARFVIHTNDTNWHQVSKAAYLMGFFAHDLAVYQVRRRHRNEEVLEAIGENYGGVLVCDRGTYYNAEEFVGVDQQKCLAHLLRNLAEVEETKTGRAGKFSSELQLPLLGGMKLWNLRRDNQIGPGDYQEQACESKDELKHQLRPRRLSDLDNQFLLDEIGHQSPLGNLTHLMEDPLVESTNNLAERLLRLAVIAHKVSQCTKNDRGCHAINVHKCSALTWQLRGLGVFGFFWNSTTACEV